MSKQGIAWLSPGLTPIERMAFFIGTAGGAGHSPFAPGTAGSLVGVLLYLGLGRVPWSLQLLCILAVTAGAVWAARVMEKKSGLHDDQRIVIDEVLGMWITLFAFSPAWAPLLVGFIVFRALDIIKPFPANWIDLRWPGPWGVVFDDIASGIYGQAVLRLLVRLTGLA